MEQQKLLLLTDFRAYGQQTEWKSINLASELLNQLKMQIFQNCLMILCMILLQDTWTLICKNFRPAPTITQMADFGVPYALFLHNIKSAFKKFDAIDKFLFENLLCNFVKYQNSE